MRDRPAHQGPGRLSGPAGAGCSWTSGQSSRAGPGPRGPAGAGPAEVSVPPALAAAVRRPGARPGPGKRPPGRVPGAHSRVSGPTRPLGLGMLRPGPAPGLAELADDVVVVAVAEDARLVRL